MDFFCCIILHAVTAKVEEGQAVPSSPGGALSFSGDRLSFGIPAIKKAAAGYKTLPQLLNHFKILPVPYANLFLAA